MIFVLKVLLVWFVSVVCIMVGAKCGIKFLEYTGHGILIASFIYTGFKGFFKKN